MLTLKNALPDDAANPGRTLTDRVRLEIHSYNLLFTFCYLVLGALGKPGIRIWPPLMSSWSLKPPSGVFASSQPSQSEEFT